MKRRILGRSKETNVAQLEKLMYFHQARQTSEHDSQKFFYIDLLPAVKFLEKGNIGNLIAAVQY